MVTIEKIRQQISDAIKNCGKKQEEIAQALNIKQTQISCYLHGKKLPSLDTLANLCIFLDLDSNELLCIKDYKSK